MDDTQTYPVLHPAAYRCWVGLGCGLLYFVVLLATLSLTSIGDTDALLLRPSLGIAPALCLYFGWPALVGCLAGDLAAHLVAGASGLLVPFMLIVDLIYFVIPYLLWYAVLARSRRPYPRLDSAAKVALCIGLFIVVTLFDAIVCAAFNDLVSLSSFDGMIVFILYLNNDFLFLIFLGIPLLTLLERSRLTPLPPPWITVPYRRSPRMPLTQKIMLVLVAAAAVISVGLISVDAVPHFIDMAMAPEDYNGLDFAILVNSTLMAISLYTVIMMAIAVIAMRYIETHFSVPIERVAAASSEFVDQVAAYRASSGDETLAVADIDTAGVHPTGEIGELIGATNQMRHDLVSYLDELERTTAEAERVSTELAIASSIQQGVVPHEFSSYKERFQLDIATVLRPAREVGGDFYDVFDIDDHRVGMIIADVSGKGMPAALFMMRALAEIREQMRYRDDVGEALTIANRALCEHNDATLFVTVFAAVLDTETGELTYANGGHNPMWRHSRESGWIPAPHSLFVGAIETVTYKTQSLSMAPGDGLFFYTDGVSEAINSDEVLFGDARLEEALRRAHTGVPGQPVTAETVVATVLAAVDAFAGDEPQFDDITMVSILWNRPVATLSVPPEDDQLEALFAFVEPFCVGEGRTKRMVFELNLILEELFVNIAHYGFPEGQPMQPVTLSVMVDEDRQMLSLTLTDAGIPYDPLTYESKKVVPGVEHRVGGLGILLVRKLVDTISYERADDLNIVRLEKRFV